jgi:DNA-binding NarL/FixJ family response regulator
VAPGLRQLRVVIVDDHAGFRRQAAALLASEGLAIVGEAVDGDGAVEATTRLAPDVVLLDVRLSDEDGFEVADRLGALASPPPVILISSRRPDEFGRRAAAGSIRGFIAKDRLDAAGIRAALDETP